MAKSTEDKLHEWAADECRRQKVGKDRIAMMLEAEKILQKCGSKFSERDLLKAAAAVEPRNSKGYRRTPVTFANGGNSTAPDSIQRAMEQLFKFRPSLSPKDFCYELLRIHPFEDGNGRLTACVYNVLSKTQAVDLPGYRF